MKGESPMNVEAVVSLIVGTIVVLLAPALMLSMDTLKRDRGTQSQDRRS
jgi:hypothetical protein